MLRRGQARLGFSSDRKEGLSTFVQGGDGGLGGRKGGVLKWWIRCRLGEWGVGWGGSGG